MLNPGGHVVTGLERLVVHPQSHTLYSLTVTEGDSRRTAKLAVLLSTRLSRLAGLWVGPWFDPVNPWTVTQLRERFGANLLMYSLDWVSYHFYDTRKRPVDLDRYVAFCSARVAEAEASATFLFWALHIPFEKFHSREHKLRTLAKLRPCFDSPFVLGIHAIDEVGHGALSPSGSRLGRHPEPGPLHPAPSHRRDGAREARALPREVQGHSPYVDSITDVPPTRAELAMMAELNRAFGFPGLIWWGCRTISSSSSMTTSSGRPHTPSCPTPISSSRSAK
jgi:hypothetical protein